MKFLPVRRGRERGEKLWQKDGGERAGARMRQRALHALPRTIPDSGTHNA